MNRKRLVDDLEIAERMMIRAGFDMDHRENRVVWTICRILYDILTTLIREDDASR